MVYSHDSFIANSKTFSIVITIINSKTLVTLLLGFISIVRGYLRGPPYQFSIANSKTLSIVCINSISINFEDSVAQF